MIVLKNRKCGSPQAGGTYAVSEMGPGGTLLPFTALAAPFPAEIENARAQQAISISATLENAVGLWMPDGTDQQPFARLPVNGVADLWGIGAGYKTVWDVIEETRQKGICRRIAQVPDVTLPCPVLMMHMNAIIDDDADFTRLSAWLQDHNIEWSPVDENPVGGLTYAPDNTVLSEPWRSVDGLGTIGDDDFVWHPYVALYKVIAGLKDKKLFSEFKREFTMDQGVFGLSWITKFAYVLEEGETSVPEELAAKGVEAAVGEDDPRAAYIQEADTDVYEDAWGELEW